jgi:hypothetical protein
LLLLLSAAAGVLCDDSRCCCSVVLLLAWCAVQILRAMAEGVDVRGLYYWTLLDNFEW